MIVGIIMLVLGNTMIMSARERTREYAVLKALGFSAKHLIGLILGESLFISAIGGGLGIFLTFWLGKWNGRIHSEKLLPRFRSGTAQFDPRTSRGFHRRHSGGNFPDSARADHEDCRWIKVRRIIQKAKGS